MASRLRCSVLPIVALTAIAGCRRARPSPAASVAASASSSAAAPHHIAHYASQGVVRGVGEGRTSVRIEHEDIPNFMKAMTMSFPVPDARLLEGIGVGDKVAFSFAYDEDDIRMWLVAIARI